MLSIIPKLNRPYSTRNANNIPYFKVKHRLSKNTFFPSVIIEWNKLDPEIQNALNLNIFKKNIFNSFLTAQNLKLSG